MINNDECGVADDNLLCHTGSVSNTPWVLYGKGDERGAGVFVKASAIRHGLF